jgi:hypothetical protein
VERVGAGAAILTVALAVPGLAGAPLMGVAVGLLVLALAIEAVRLREVRSSVRAG